MRVTKFSNLSELPKMFEDLFSRAERKSVFFAKAWFVRTCEHFIDSSERLRLYGVHDEEQAFGLLVAIESPPAKGPIKLLELRTLQGCTTTQSFRAALLLDPKTQDEGSVLRTLFAFLKDSSSNYDCIDLDLLCLTDNQVKDWKKIIESCGLSCHIEHQEWNRYEDVEGVPFSKLAKKSTKRRERKLAKEKTLKYEMYTKPSEMGVAQTAYEDIYRRTWKQADIGRDFAAELILDYAERGWIRFLVIYADEEPIAAECFIVYNGIANSFRTAYDLAYRDYSVGSIVLQRMLEHVIKYDDIKEIDFGPGDEPYKQQWLSKRRKLWRIRSYNRSGVPANFQYRLKRLGDQVEQLKQGPVGDQLRKARQFLRNIR